MINRCKQCLNNVNLHRQPDGTLICIECEGINNTKYFGSEKVWLKWSDNWVEMWENMITKIKEDRNKIIK